MASALFPSYKALILGAGLNLTSSLIKVALIKNTYTYNSAHDFYDDVSANVAGTPQTLSGKTVTSGVFNNSAGHTFTAVTAGATVNALILYYDSTVAGTSSLIAYIDNAGTMSIATNGGDITVAWDTGANKIFAL